jgi:hypothetical protein
MINSNTNAVRSNSRFLVTPRTSAAGSMLPLAVALCDSFLSVEDFAPVGCRLIGASGVSGVFSLGGETLEPESLMVVERRGESIRTCWTQRLSARETHGHTSARMNPPDLVLCSHQCSGGQETMLLE